MNALISKGLDCNINSVRNKMFCAMKCAFVLLYLPVIASDIGDQPGTVGQEFYIGVLKPWTDSGVKLLITLHAPGVVNIEIPNLGINTTKHVTGSLEYEVSSDIDPETVATVESKGIRVTTDVNATVTAVMSRGGGDVTDGFLALPYSMTSRKYIIASYEAGDSHENYKSSFLIVTTNDNTTVEIRNQTSDVQHVLMNALDTYWYTSADDLSGTIIQSSERVSVFSGHEATAVPRNCRGSAGVSLQYIVEQLPPTDLFAKNFIIPPVPPQVGYEVRVFSSEANTSVEFISSTTNESKTIAEVGEFVETLSAGDPSIVIADKPVLVMLYGTCHGYKDRNIGDSFMSTVPAIDQFKNAYYITVSRVFTGLGVNFLAVICKSNLTSGLRINGQAVTSALRAFREYKIDYAGEEYTVNIYNMSVGVYRLWHESTRPFGAFLYGFDRYNGYGYPLGYEVEHIRKVADCGTPKAPDNGSVYTGLGTKYLSTAIFSCNKGFDLIGPSTSECQSNGAWSRNSPACVITDCGMPYKPENGSVYLDNNRTKYQSTATFSCNTGFGLTGSNRTACQANGSWSGTSPKCTIKGEKLTCLECTDMSHPYLCDNVNTCSQGQICYVETFTTSGGLLKFNSGCADYGKCSRQRRQTSTRSPKCIHCCSSPACNMEGCGSQGLPLRGPLCYDCSHVSSMDECKTVTLCAQDEVCIIERYLWGGIYDHYTAKCHSKQCFSQKRSYDEKSVSRMASRSTPVCRQCCTRDLCNTKCNNTSNSGPGVAIVG